MTLPNNLGIRQQYIQHYTNRVSDFVRDIGEVEVAGIPEVHLPLWGEEYEASKLKIAVVGIDTRYWGNMADFIAAAKHDVGTAIFRNEVLFHQLAFTQWTTNFGTSFWDTTMQFLALFHGIQDWQQLKRRQHDGIFRSFAWAETNSVERWESAPSVEEAKFDAWRTVKIASEKHFDSFKAILDIFHPDVAVIMNWNTADQYWDVALDWEPIRHHVNYAFDAQHSTHVFHTSHPNGMRQDREEIFKAIATKWNLLSDANRFVDSGTEFMTITPPQEE